MICSSHMVEQDFTVPAHRAPLQSRAGVLERNGELNSLSLRPSAISRASPPRSTVFTGIVEVLQGDEVGNPSYLAEVIQTKRASTGS